MAAQHLNDLLNRPQATPYRVVRPGFEEMLVSHLEAVAPELSEVLLSAPGPTDFHFVLAQSPKQRGLPGSATSALFQPDPSATLQRQSTCLGQLAVLLLF